MLPDIENLLQLQEADREILRLNEEVAALPRRVSAIEEKLAGTRAQLEKAKASVKADEAARRKYETAISDLQQKISKYRDQSLEVKTNDQYKALLHEIEFAQKEIQGNEDKILELMVNSESREKEVKAAEAELKAETAEIETEKAEARRVTEEDQKRLAEWNTKRSGLREGVNVDLLRHYERVLKLRKSGLSEVRDHKCMACQVMLRPQTYNEVRGGTTIVICDSCQRILYFNPANEKAAEPASAQARRRTRPKADAPQAWFYRPDYVEHGEVLIGFANSGGSSSRRVYEMHSGRQVGDILVREGNYRLAFPEDLTDSAVRLNGHWEEEEMDGWGSEMPSSAMDVLHRDLYAAQAEGHAPRRNSPNQVSSEHPAAS
jgi:uncharacterized protein